MSIPGRYVSLTPARRVVSDIMDACRDIPFVAVTRTMNIQDVMLARSSAPARPSWNAIFTKAYAQVATETPELRQLFISWPWGRLYESAENVASIAVELEIAGEKIPTGAQVHRPETMDLLALTDAVAGVKNNPDRCKAYRRSMRVACLPRPLRRLLWWIGMEWSGAARAHFLGTLGVTSVSHVGADAAALRSPLGNCLTYGPVDAAGNVRIMLTFDHRIMDGSVAGRVLARLNAVLTSEILCELRGLQARAAA